MSEEGGYQPHPAKSPAPAAHHVGRGSMGQACSCAQPVVLEDDANRAATEPTGKVRQAVERFLLLVESWVHAVSDIADPFNKSNILFAASCLSIRRADVL